MNVTSIQFLLLAAVAGGVIRLTKSEIVRHFCICLANALLLASFAPTVEAAAPLLAFIFLGFLVIKVSRLDYCLPAGLACMVILFIFIKKYAIIPDDYTIQFSYQVVGLSYILFRIIHVAVDVRGKVLSSDISFAKYFAYVLFFPAMISGPIQRLDEFEEQVAVPESLDDKAVGGTLLRVSTGFVKVLIVSPIIFAFFNYVLVLVGGVGSGALISSVSPAVAELFINGRKQSFLRELLALTVLIPSYLFYLYVNFSGYCDIVIGISRLVGVKLPENFDRPLAARNLLDFWSRWHISLSQWFKVYLFNPSLKMLLFWAGPKFAKYVSVVVYAFTFLVMGIWHGTSVEFIIYGCFLGAGVGLNKLYQIKADQLLGKARYSTMRKSVVYSHMARSLTITVFAISLICLWKSASDMSALATLFSFKGGAILFAVLLIGFVIGLPLLDIADRAHLAAMKIISTSRNLLAIFIAGQFLVAIYYYLSNETAAPEFVYKAF